MTALSTPRPAPFFISGHLALDFLNSTATPTTERIEWLEHGADLLDWLERAGAVEHAVATRFRSEADARAKLDAMAEQARLLREWLRAFVQRHAGNPLGPEALAELAPLNELLAQADTHAQVEAARTEAGQHALQMRRVRRWTAPEQLLHPIAEAIGDLVCQADFRLIRACEAQTCTLVFLDTTKSHARRWCSMAICGNRAKAAAHRARAAGRQG